MIAAIIAGGGHGSRFGGYLPKQFAFLGKMPVIARTLAAFQSAKDIEAIIVVCPDGFDRLTKDIAHAYNIDKLFQVIVGGKTRQLSVRNGLLAAKEIGADYVMIHDAARPFVTSEILAKNARAVIDYSACATAEAVVSTLAYSSDNHTFKSITPRDGLYALSTPQSFKLSLILDAHEKAFASDDFSFTDDVGLCLKYTTLEPLIVEGSSRNIKITHAEDLRLAEAILSIM